MHAVERQHAILAAADESCEVHIDRKLQRYILDVEKDGITRLKMKMANLDEDAESLDPRAQGP